MNQHFKREHQASCLAVFRNNVFKPFLFRSFSAVILATAGSYFSAAVADMAKSSDLSLVPPGKSINKNDPRYKHHAVQPLQLLWFADFESASTHQWKASTFQPTPCGGEFSGAGGAVSLSQEFTHRGDWSLKMTIPGLSKNEPIAGARMHRWCEPQRHRELYYSVWYFIPRHYTLQKGGWLNWFQFKSKRPNGVNDPFFFLDIKSDEVSRSMKFMLTWWGGHTFSGPKHDQKGYRTWVANETIPVGRWFHVEAKYVCAGDFTGAIQVWQDGKEIFYLDHVKTRHGDGDCQWGVNNYGTGVSPSPVTIYIDDAAISTTRLGPTVRLKN